MPAKTNLRPIPEPASPPDGTRKGPRGLGSMRHIPLDLDPRIDLTQPIYEQVLALQKLDEAAGQGD